MGAATSLSLDREKVWKPEQKRPIFACVLVLALLSMAAGQVKGSGNVGIGTIAPTQRRRSIPDIRRPQSPDRR